MTPVPMQSWVPPPMSRMLSGKNVYELLRNAAELFPADSAMVFLTGPEPGDEVQSFSHRDNFARVIQSANLFSQLGIGCCDVVTLLTPNLPQMLWCMWGAEIAAIANPVNYLLEPAQIISILRQAGSKAVVVPDAAAFPEIEAKLEVIRSQMPALIVIRLGATVAKGEISYDSEAPKQCADRLTTQRDLLPEATAALFHTGGTTGTPKLARHHHGGIAAASFTNIAGLSGEREILLSPLPYFHVAGAVLCGLAAVANGWTIVIPTALGARNPRVVANYWRILAEHGVTVGAGVPTSLAAVVNIPRGGQDLRKLKMIVTGGSSTPVELIRTLQQQLEIPVIESYGMTELHCLACFTAYGKPVRPGSVGHRVPFMEMRVAHVDEAGRIVQDCEQGDIGHLLFRGPQVFQGYVDREHDRGVLLADGWLDSGDLARVDSDGYLWLTGRAKDLIIRSSHNIDPLLIEDALSSHPSVEIAAAVGKPDAYAGELPIAFIKLRADMQVGVEDLMRFARERIVERAAMPAEIVLVEAMPLTPVGKIFKPALRMRAAREVFDRAVEPLRARGVSATVLMVPDAVHGLIARIAVDISGRTSLQYVCDWCRQHLGVYQVRHEVVSGGVDSSSGAETAVNAATSSASERRSAEPMPPGRLVTD